MSAPSSPPENTAPLPPPPSLQPSPPFCGLVPRTYKVLCEAVEYGAAYGCSRAHKHIENPTEEQLLTAIEESVMNSICEAFHIIEPTEQ